MSSPIGVAKRLNGGMMASSVGEIACIIGEVQSREGDSVTVRTSDGMTVTVNTAADINDYTSSIVEIVGRVESASEFTAYKSTAFSDGFSLELYDSLVGHIATKFAHLF
eukprot:PLAT4677.1.p1 GENE.PLAT4677.1~~PLAT4677.1.p1  ORF type:complete len:127 (-),score=34.15 PLAT4677.1:84-410(-)